MMSITSTLPICPSSIARGAWVLGNWAIKRAFPNGKNYDKYDRLVIVYPFKEGEECGWLGVTNVKPNALQSPLSSSFGYLLIRAGLPHAGVDVMVHEFGHSLGMYHSAMTKMAIAIFLHTKRMAIRNVPWPVRPCPTIPFS